MDTDDDEDFPGKKILFSLLTITTFFALLHPSAASADGGDADVMAKLAKSLSPAPSGWSGPNHCKWSGVSCDSSGRVSNINLAAKRLSGQLPSDLSQLSGLKTLSLQRNYLSGPIPSLSRLSSLQQLFLDNNNFTSVPSDFLSGLTSLQTLSLGRNPNLPPWTLPETLADSTALNSLDAVSSNLAGAIPEIFGSLPNLQSVRLSYNNLTGSLPESFSKTSIENLWLNNQLTGLSGRIDVLGAMSQLTEAWVHVNQFSGPIPDLSKCVSLSDLQLRDNELTGVVHPSLFSLPKLANISLQNNRLQGPYPDFPEGVEVSIGMTNNFCNSSPGPCDPQVTALLAVAEALGYPMALAESWKGNDPCQGWNGVSCDTGGGRVSVIDFGKKQWSGTISPAIANLTALKSVLLNDNKLTGSIPGSLTSLSQLQLLDVSNNNLFGRVPPFASNVAVKTSGNPFIGKDLPSEGGGRGRGGDTSAEVETSANGKPSRWVIVVAVIAVGLFVVVLSFLIYKRFAKKQSWKYKWVKSSSLGEVKGKKKCYGAICELPTPDKNMYDGGSVEIPIAILRQVTDNFSEFNILGQGGFGVVYKGKLHDGTEIAVKRMECVMAGSKGQSEFQAEIEVLSKVRHRHLVVLHGFCVNGNERLLVYQYMPQGTLGQHLFKYKEMGLPPLTWKQRVTIALDVARGVEYLHGLAQQSFIHRDLKPSNILLGDDMRAKVSDFGLVKNALDGKYSVETRLAGTFGYLAPEYASTGRVTTKVDVFAFGVVLMEMTTGRKALDESLPEETSHLVTWFRRLGVNRESIREYIDPTLTPDEETVESIYKVAELAGHCTALEPFLRPDMSHVVNVLSPLVEQWKPTAYEDNGLGIDLHMTLPQALQRWQTSDASSMSTSYMFNNASTNIQQQPSGFTNSGYER